MTEDKSSADQPEMVAAAVSDDVYTLFVADFSDTTTAWDAYEALKEVEDGRHVEIEGVIVVKREPDGDLEIQKATDHSTKRGLKWGAAGGLALGLIFPPSILGSAAVIGAAGAGIGKAQQLRNKAKLAEELEDSIEPGHSGIVALVSNPAAAELRKALERADRIVESAVNDAVAKELKAAAKEIEAGQG
ncbi:MAG TPA: DUF1269 domain-containing protein [Nocardioides sp.]|uniref:DUF1269 domain-containing protein n=1 Tax=Nocardioides sp. TaxID=35761 RepID=UPI002D0A0B2E|nr:DUF1269 domain-containing protein [Nocardioides sp.]HQR26406.1 DUF1269 domain-containing protein [Nocardioides sp.]